MALTLKELESALLSRLHEVVTGGDEYVQPDQSKFITWCRPGIPFTPDDFNFLTKLGNGATAEEERTLLRQAYSFSRFMDFIPDAGGVYDGDQQQKIFSTSGKRLSEMYDTILKAAKVVNHELTKKEKDKLDKFRKLLWSKKKVTNLVTDEETEVIEKSIINQLYDEKMMAYIQALQVYNSKRIAATSAKGEDARGIVLDWMFNETTYRLSTVAAKNAWVSGGYKNEVEGMQAYINALGERNSETWRKQLRDNFDRSVLSDPMTGDFNYTGLIPSNFFNDGSGWTAESFSSTDVNQSTNFSSKGFTAKVGYLGFGVDASGSKSTSTSDLKVEKLKVSFELCQAIIDRPWFYPSFFSNRGWTLNPGQGWNFERMPSDGNIDNPQGECIGYPTSVLFVRNLVIESSEIVQKIKDERSKIGAGGSVSWSCFNVGGSYAQEDNKSSLSYEESDSSIKVKGLQIIGFVNSLIPKSPNPLPNLKFE